jgi:hypothetical protein
MSLDLAVHIAEPLLTCFHQPVQSRATASAGIHDRIEKDSAFMIYP